MAKIGIDFGTTNSLIVAYDREDGFKYFNYSGERPVPTSSTIWYHGADIVVGNKAREKISKCDAAGNHFEKSIKSKLGLPTKISILGKMQEPYQIASEIIKHLRNEAINKYNANKSHIDMNRAVFTIPISFDGKAREDLRKAANEANIEVMSFVHEPFAGIVGYYFSREELPADQVISKLRNLEGKYILTFDWGGGTLDITIVKIMDGKMYEVGTSELTNIAGDKFDELIANKCWNDFIDEYGYKYSEDYLEKARKNKWGKILAEAEKCKIALSTSEVKDILIEHVMDDDDIDIDFKREDFNKLIEMYVVKAINKIDEAIKEAGISEGEIDKVLLTGGTSYIPYVQAQLREKFGHRVEAVKNADLVIAQGAAVIAELGWIPFLTKDIYIQLSDESYWPLFNKNFPIALDKNLYREERFTVINGTQKYANIILSEGENQTPVTSLGILKVPLGGNKFYGEDIIIKANIDRNIVLNITSHSLVEKDNITGMKYADVVTMNIYKLCFGLDFIGDINGK